jgi:N-acetylglutamate synthase-like GNAT family acetyltransferase
MKFRKATIDDLPLLNHISVTSKGHWGYPEEWMQAWKDELILIPSDLSTMDTLVMEFGPNTIGFCAIKDQGKQYEVMHLWVLPEFIGKGFGNVLLKEALTAFVLEQKPIWVLADPNAESFYKKQGFMTFDKVESFPKGRYLPLMKMNPFFEA